MKLSFPKSSIRVWGKYLFHTSIVAAIYLSNTAQKIKQNVLNNKCKD